MDLQLKGKKAIVTGASRGIGRSIAELLADEGCDVAVCARGEAGVAETVKALEAKGVKAWGQAVDIADGPALTTVPLETDVTIHLGYITKDDAELSALGESFLGRLKKNLERYVASL